MPRLTRTRQPIWSMLIFSSGMLPLQCSWAIPWRTYAFGQGEYDFNGGKSDNYDTWTLALIHSLSKRTKVYAGFSEVDCDARVMQSTVAVPPPATVGIDSSACGNVDQNNLGKGGEDDKFSLGMKHTF